VRSRAFAVFAALAILGVSGAVPAGAQAPLSVLYGAPTPTLTADLNVTAVFAGIVLSPAERASLLGQVNATWSPAVTSLREPLGANFTVRVRTVDASEGFLAAYAQFLNISFANDTLTRQVQDYIGLFANVSPYMPAWHANTPVRHADGAQAAQWLASAQDDFPEVGAPPGEARLFFLNVEAEAQPYYYAVASRDLDRSADFLYETANAWADGDGVFFQDLRAAPGHLGESSGVGRPANFAGMAPAWSYGASAQERARLVSDLAHYIDRSVKAIVAPSFGVTPFDASSVTLDVTLFDATGAQTLFQAGGAGASRGINRTQDLLNETLVDGGLHALAPYTVFQMGTATANRTSDPQVASALARSEAFQGSAIVLDPFALSGELKARWNVPSVPVVPGEALRVPVFIAVYDGEAWVDSVNVRGVTLQRSDGRAAAIVIAAGLPQLDTRGFSETLVHEGGHSLGLGHPHEVSSLAPNGTVVTEVDWLRSSTSTPMTYLPVYVDYSFDSFDRHSLWVGVAAATLGEAYALRQKAFERFDLLGYGEGSLPPAVGDEEAVFENYSKETGNLLKRGILYIEAAPPYTDGGAIVMSKRAYDEARGMMDASLAAPRCCGGDIAPRFLPGPEAAVAALAIAVAAGAIVLVARRRR
jgi:hypothetical protein